MFLDHFRPLSGFRTSRLRPALLALALTACVGAEAAPDDGGPAIPVIVRPAGRVDRPDYVGLSGDIEAIRMANVGFLVPGVVRVVGPREGEAVGAGEMLAELDQTEYQMNVDLAAAQAERAEQEYGRARQIFEAKGIPENDFQKAETGVKMARVGEAMARKKLADTRLLAPFSGVVARRSIEPGEQTGPGYPVFTIVLMDPLRVKVGVPEAEIGRFRVGQRAIVSIPSLGGDLVEGRVELVGVAADPASRTYTVKATLPNGSGRLRPGMIAEVRIEHETNIAALTLPGDAILRSTAGVTSVFVYQPSDQRVYARRVEVGTAFGTEVEIRSGLGPDDQVVVGGQHKVREGTLVVAQAAAGAAVAPAAATPADTSDTDGEGR